MRTFCILKEKVAISVRNVVGMVRVVFMGTQDFEKLTTENYFYIDKTQFIKEWWENKDAVTLITQPRYFGKMLNLNMLERFFSIKYWEKGEILGKLCILAEEKYRKSQGTYSVIFLYFALVNENIFRIQELR